MNKPQIFNFNGNQVRTVVIDGVPWWVAKDVCDVLGLSNPSESLKALDDDERTTLRISEGGPQANVISEGGLYSLVIRSNKPEARVFRKWVTNEVLPEIRKTGHYQASGMTPAEVIAAIANQAVEQERRLKQLESKADQQSEVVETIKETFLQRDDDWRKSINKMLNGAAYRLGGGYQDLRNRSYEVLEERAKCNLKVRLSNLVERLEESGATKTQLKNTSRMDVIEADPRLKEIYSTIVKELAIGAL